jgi:hypothetical protein
MGKLIPTHVVLFCMEIDAHLNINYSIGYWSELQISVAVLTYCINLLTTDMKM